MLLRVQVRSGIFLDAHFKALDMAVVVVRQLARANECPGNLQEAKTHQAGAERYRAIHDPRWHLHVGGYWALSQAIKIQPQNAEHAVVSAIFPDKPAAE